MTSCDWQQFLKAEQPVEDWYDWVNDIFVARVGLQGDGDHTCLGSVLCSLTRSVCTQEEPVHARVVQSVKVWSAIKAARFAVGQKMVRSSTENRSFSSFSSEESALGKKPVQKTREERDNESRTGKVQGIGSTNGECHEPNAALSAVKRVESSSHSDSYGGNGAPETYSGEKA